MQRALSLIAILGALSAVPISAQGQDAAPRLADVATVDGIISAVYASISAPKGVERDWPRLRSLMAPDARFMPTGQRADGSWARLVWDTETYVAQAGPGLVANGFYEREIASRVEQYGRVVHVFSTYESRHAPEDPEPSMRGINSFQLWNDGTRWWVVSILWEGERAANPIPARYLPGAP